jgi:gliding motility-associated-like protein
MKNLFLSRRSAVLTGVLLTFVFFACSAQETCDCPSINECGACTDGITSLSLKYTGNVSTTVNITIDDKQVTVFSGPVDPGDTIVINGTSSNGKFVGNKLSIWQDDVLKTTVNVSCDPPIYLKSVMADFTVVGGKSKSGGALCCDPSTVEHVPAEILNCPSEIHRTLAEGSCCAVINWVEPTVTDNCELLSFTSSHQPGQTFNPGTTTVVYAAIDKYGNSATCSFDVVLQEDIVPVHEIDFDFTKVLTPDGDGVNDKWVLFNIDKYPDNSVTIVDRWGSVVFAGSGYDNESVVWKGQNTSGTTVATGTYFYAITIRAGSDTVRKRGFIELIRPK